MPSKEPADEATLHRNIRELCSQFQTVLMATSSCEAKPEISYTPYTIVDGRLFVFVSDLSLHTGNLKENPKASLLFIEDEKQSDNLHARRRVTFPATATLIQRNDPVFDEVLSQMQSQFGQIIPVLKSLPDFHLFAMETDCATIVRGFADAHTIKCDGFAS